MSDTQLSFITVNYRTPELIDRLVTSIISKRPTFPYEIIVVDNSEGVGAATDVARDHPDVKYIDPGKNLGFGAGNNLGAKEAGGNYIVIINSDCMLGGSSFDSPVRYMEENPDIGIMGLKVIRDDGVLEPTARGFPDASTGLFGRSTFLGKIAQRTKLGKTGMAKKNLMTDGDATEPYDVDWVAGTMMIIRRDCWDKLNGFDEDYFMYWEDADICYRATKLGYRIVYYPGVYVKHGAGKSAERNRIPSIKWFHQSAYLYVVKNISPQWSFIRAFAWFALNLRARLQILKASIKG